MESLDNEEQVEQQFPKLYKAIISENCTDLEEQLKIASLFIMSFECFQDYAQEHFRDFFSSHFKTDKNGDLVSGFDEGYKAKEKEYNERYCEIAARLLDEGQLKKNKRPNLLKAACAFFHTHEAFDDQDFIQIHHILWLRNEITHELLKWIISEEFPSLTREYVYAPLSLYKKMANWWVINVEAAIDPEAYERFSEEDMQTATAMNVEILLQMLHRALPE